MAHFTTIDDILSDNRKHLYNKFVVMSGYSEFKEKEITEDNERIIFQQLLGVYDEFSDALAKSFEYINDEAVTDATDEECKEGYVVAPIEELSCTVGYVIRYNSARAVVGLASLPDWVRIYPLDATRRR